MHLYVWCVAAILACRFGNSEAAPAEELSFDYGWRFHLGDPAVPPPPPSPPSPQPPPPPASCPGGVNTTFPVAEPKELTGLTANKGAQTAAACGTACCTAGPAECGMWQYQDAKGCWMGFGKPFKTPTHSSWEGGSRRGKKPKPPPAPQPPSTIPTNPAAAATKYDDSQWPLIDLPHDYIVEGAFDRNTPSDGDGGGGGAGQSYLPRSVGYYRKHFTLPSDWQGSTVWIRFDGVFRETRIWLNGVRVRDHAAFPGSAHGEGGGAGMGGGYTSFNARLDNVSSVVYGDGTENVLTVYVDPRAGSGWFYEGGGIYRKTWLHSAPNIHIEQDGVFATTHVAAVPAARPTPSLGSAAASATISVTTTMENTATTSGGVGKLSYALFDASGAAVPGSTATASVKLDAAKDAATPATNTAATISIAVADAELWSVARPYLYTLHVTTDAGDALNVSVGIYSTKWTSDQGFFMNDEKIKIRGFCNHESFGGVGMAIPDRINLFRAQALRSVGGNGWRMSHNPVSIGLLDVLDRVGVVAMEESRIMGTDDVSIMNMGAMVKRDRNHPSIVIWSYCNEGGCHQGAQGFQRITHAYDTTRPTLGNNARLDNNGSFTDVQGFSHSLASVFDSYHAQHPRRPTFASECCSCSTQRGADAGVSFGCTANQSNASNSRDFVAGTMVWTLFDYYGESHGWPSVSSSYGQIDIAGFIKNTGRWYRTWWLSAVPESDAARPVGFGAAHSCHAWRETWCGAVCSIRVLTEAATVTLYEDGTATATAQVPDLDSASLTPTLPAAKNTTVACLSKSGVVLATDRLIASAQNASAIVLSIDAPSVATGTGSSLVLDGHDVGMLRATIVDSNGAVVAMSVANVTFAVTAGPGRILATHNGDNKNHQLNHGAVHAAFQGLVRGIVQVTEHRTGTAGVRARIASIDKESAHVTTVTAGGGPPPPAAITVTATSPGLISATIDVPVSDDEAAHGVLQAATDSMLAEQHWD